ncbi:unspecific monooxygenase [Bacteriovorax sp. DB6_IX]|nr:unspecific monooxygenase [Bacteriovorax sp. DB6_IX]
MLKPQFANDNRKSSFKKILSFVKLDHIPGPRGFRYIQSVREFQKNILNAFTQTYLDYGHIASFPWPMNSIIIYSPEYIKKVLVDDNRNYIKGEQIEEIKAVVGNGLATNNDHQSWLKARAAISKQFNKNAVNSFTEEISSIADNFFGEAKNSDLDICEQMKLLTFKIACQVFLGGDLSHKDAMKVNDAVEFTSIVTYERIFKFFPLPYWVPTPTHLEFSQHYKNLIHVVNKLISRSSAKDSSILSKLLFAKDDNGQKAFTEKEARDEILTIMLASHETSAHTLTWFFGLIAKHQDIQERIYQEVLNQDQELNDQNYPELFNALYETMRLYPAFPVLSRKAKKKSVLGDYHIPKNTNVVIPIYVLQRAQEFWERPLEFEPQRFQDRELLKSYKYLPYSRGPRRCVGELFAMTEMAIIIKSLILKFHFNLLDKDLPQDEAFVSLKPKDGLPVKLLLR